MSAKRFSFCTTCMGRLHHLKQTLPYNLSLLKDRSDCEIVLLDYNSADGLSDWVRDNFNAEIDHGLLIFCRTSEPQFFMMAHAKNVAHLCGTGTIVCNLDADNFLTKTFLDFVTETFRTESSSSLSCDRSNVGSRIALRKDDFVRVGGYDENFKFGWGTEDSDFIMRLESMEIPRVTTHNLRLLGSDLSHADGERNALTELKLPKEESSLRNSQLLLANLQRGVFIANRGKEWGVAEIERNFSGTLEKITRVSIVGSNAGKEVLTLMLGDSLSTIQQIWLAAVHSLGYRPVVISENQRDDLPAFAENVAASTLVPPGQKLRCREKTFYHDLLKVVALNQRGGWWLDDDLVLSKLPAVGESGYFCLSTARNAYSDWIIHTLPGSLLFQQLRGVMEEMLERGYPQIPASQLYSRLVASKRLHASSQEIASTVQYYHRGWEKVLESGATIDPTAYAVKLWANALSQRGVDINGVFPENTVVGILQRRFIN